jgi:hypothetical protein
MCCKTVNNSFSERKMVQNASKMRNNSIFGTRFTVKYVALKRHPNCIFM